MKPETDIIRQVYCEDGYFITVRPWVEADGVVCMKTDGEENQKYYGKFEVTMSPEMAIELGKSLLACADDLIKTDE